MNFYILASIFAPLLSFVIAGIFSFSKKRIVIGLISTFLVIFGTVCSCALFEVVITNGSLEIFYLSSFINIGFFQNNFCFLIDELSTTMMVVVGVVASIVHIYSIGYMEHDKNFNKFFSFLGLFVFSMLFLVMSNNFLGLFIGWEGVGLCSWLLIGFWYDKKGVSWCANEAFIMNRIADVGMLVGIFLIFIYTGSLNFSDLFDIAPNLSKEIVLFMGIALLIGAMGKSAQFPFHTWLADAMVGPTPVSALIHAATMVTAGVWFLVV